jgi:hypothetical protein
MDCEIHHSRGGHRWRTLTQGLEIRENVMPRASEATPFSNGYGMTDYELAANRYLLIGCAGLITLIITLLFVALR